MPKRTNDFQKLILEINKHFASSTAEVFESKMLFDPRSEQEREIDIYIEDSIAGYKLKLGIECTTLKSKVGVQVLDVITAKHKAVGINKTIVVSKHGFTETAQKQAQSEGVELITYEAAANRDWPEYVDNLMQIELNHIEYKVVSVELGFVDGQDISDFEASKDLLVIMKDYQPHPMVQLLIILLEQSADDYINSDDLNQSKLYEGVEFNRCWDFDPPCVLRDTLGNMALCSKLGGRFIVKLNKISPQMHWGNYGNRFAASGTQKNIGPFASATITSSTTGEFTEDGLHKYSLKISLNTKNFLE